MKTLDTLLEENTDLEDYVIKEETFYNKSGEITDCFKTTDSGSCTINIVANDEEDAEYTLGAFSQKIIKDLDTTENQIYLKLWYNTLKETKNIHEALGKAILDLNMYKVLKKFVDSDKKQ